MVWTCQQPSLTSCRTISQTDDGVTSQALPVKSGVPQGSILGPLLFLLYINNLPSCLSPEDSSIVLYPDDILLYRPIKTESDCKLFQWDINKIFNWISDNHLTVNVVKTKCMTISRLSSTIPLQVEVNGHQIEEVVTFKYLGVWISSDLSWTKHIEITCSKARWVLGYMYRTFELPTLESRRKYFKLLLTSF